MKIKLTDKQVQFLIRQNKKQKTLRNINRKDKLSYTLLHELIFYDPIKGHFYWTSKAGKKKAGNRAESRWKNDYRSITIDGINYPAHRLAWFYMEGYFPEHEIDHIDRCKYNNKWKNLRHVTKTCNSRNKGLHPKNKSGVTGVYRCGNKWKVTIGHAGINLNLNSYSDMYTAVKVRWEAEKILKYPDCQTTSTAYIWLKEYDKRQIQIKELITLFKEI